MCFIFMLFRKIFFVRFNSFIFLLFFLPGSNKKPCFCWQISFTKHTNLSGKH